MFITVIGTFTGIERLIQTITVLYFTRIGFFFFLQLNFNISKSLLQLISVEFQHKVIEGMCSIWASDNIFQILINSN